MRGEQARSFCAVMESLGSVSSVATLDGWWTFLALAPLAIASLPGQRD
jgi:hypothetical protein